MRFAADIWLWGVFFALVLGAIFVAQGLRLARARKKFGQDERVKELLTSKTGGRRAVSAVLTCLAVAFAFLAAAQPQYGRGTRVLPATNLDVVLVLDFSKSMYARDVSPSRIGRAKVEVARLVRELGGARFGAVAFAGESISFPLTSDGAAIAQFFRGLEPNDMPLGGTAIARALQTGRQLLDRDPLSKNHERVLILITDGEDLEGDPVDVARTIRQDGMRVEVVQIGGQSPEPIPDIGEDGEMRGLRRDASGQIMTTAPSVEGEAQLASVASEGGGQVVRAATGQVGIDEMSTRLRKLMTEELSERVETVYADVFHYPLAVAVLLLMIEVWIGTAKRRVIAPQPPRGKRRPRRLKRLESSAVLLALVSLGCSEFDQTFERKSPEVEEAIALLVENKHDEATEKLIDYLETGPCEEGVIGVGDRARKYTDASYDLALALSAADAPNAKDTPDDPSAALAQGQQIPGMTPTPPTDPSGAPQAASDPKNDCALRLLAPIGPNENLPTALRARAYYLEGNIELARGSFEAAVSYFDQALLLVPGVDEGDPLGKQIAYNRALALRLLKEQKEKQEQEQQNSDQNEEDSDEESDESKDDSEHSEDDNEGDEQDEEQKDEQQDQEQDQDQEEQEKDKQDGSDQKDEEQEDEKKDEQQQSGDSEQAPEQQEQKQQPQPQQAQESGDRARDERMLDMLEQAPTLQQHDAQKRQGQPIRGRATMEDK